VETGKALFEQADRLIPLAGLAEHLGLLGKALGIRGKPAIFRRPPQQVEQQKQQACYAPRDL